MQQILHEESEAIPGIPTVILGKTRFFKPVCGVILGLDRLSFSSVIRIPPTVVVQEMGIYVVGRRYRKKSARALFHVHCCAVRAWPAGRGQARDQRFLAIARCSLQARAVVDTSGQSEVNFGPAYPVGSHQLAADCLGAGRQDED